MKIIVKEIIQLDPDSVGIMLDIDGVADAAKWATSGDLIRRWVGKELNFWDLISFIIAIWTMK